MAYLNLLMISSRLPSIANLPFSIINILSVRARIGLLWVTTKKVFPAVKGFI